MRWFVVFVLQLLGRKRVSYHLHVFSKGVSALELQPFNLSALRHRAFWDWKFKTMQEPRPEEWPFRVGDYTTQGAPRAPLRTTRNNT